MADYYETYTSDREIADQRLAVIKQLQAENDQLRKKVEELRRIISNGPRDVLDMD